MNSVLEALAFMSRAARSAVALQRRQRLPTDSRVRAEDSEQLRRIRAHDLSDRSDGDLLEAVARLKRFSDPDLGPADDLVPELFALVGEAVRRRLGAWRVFDRDFDKGELRRYEELADEILRSGPHRDRIAFYTNPDYLDGEPFQAAIGPMLEGMGLDGAERTIVGTIVYVAERSRTEYRSRILLPADFYRALSERDLEGVTTFRATDEQLVAGLLLCRKRVVEMSAGEGKTVAAAFPAVLQALMGKAVHVITSNDYLAARDADLLAPVYESLGLTVGAVLGSMGDEERRHAYEQQIVYGTLREFGFDFLRDNLKLPPDEPVQRGLEVAIVDEADHALIDQARTPLVISGAHFGSRRAFDKTRRAIEEIFSVQTERVVAIETLLRQGAGYSRGRIQLLAKMLLADPDNESLKAHFARAPRDYRLVMAAIDADELRDGGERLSSDLPYLVDALHRSVTLTEKGQEALERRLGPLFDSSLLERELASIESRSDLPLRERQLLAERSRRRIFRQNSRMSQVYQMLRAYVLLKRDVDYVVTDSQVVLVDELTGRTLPDGRFQQGLHAALEAKEGVPIHPECETLAQVSVQGFANLYSQVSGMTGTAFGARDEFRRVYGLTVVGVPTTRAVERADLGTRLYLDRRSKLAAIVDEVKVCRAVGRPVLVGTLTIEQSAEISRLLGEQGIAHNLLNAVNDAEEATIIKNAGAFGSVTIATNMAGRGTDILLETGIDGRIVQGYVDLTLRLLNDGVPGVELACATRGEADLLAKALTADHGMTVTQRRDGPPYRTVVAASGQTDDPGPGRTRLEFGLGLCVIGTEMNQSGRIDRQLRGRSGRQGAFGGSRFNISLEDRVLAFRGDKSKVSGTPRSDASTRPYFEGPGLDRYLASVQADIEADDEVRRGLMHDYARVMEAQTLAYYRARRRVLSGDAIRSLFGGSVERWAGRLVDRHFPGFRVDDYEAQFNAMAEELWLDFECDCGDLEGAGIGSLAEEVSARLRSRFEEARARTGDAVYAGLERLLYVQTADELWRDHIAELQELIPGIALGFPDHKAAVAEYITRCFEAYERFEDRVVDVFLPRLREVTTHGVSDDREDEAVPLEEVSRILI